MKVGDKIMFRSWGSLGLGTHVTIAPHQDEGFVSIQLANGLFVSFDGSTGAWVGNAPTAGGAERVIFSGNALVACPMDNGVALPYEAFGPLVK